jgi:hypothetical protein
MSGIEMCKGQFNRLRVGQQRFAILFPNQRSSPLEMFEQFFFSSRAAIRIVSSMVIERQDREVARIP